MDTAPALAPGLDHPVYDSIKVFRALADAMSHPGEIQCLHANPPAPRRLMPASAAICLALLDFETPLWLQSLDAAVVEYLRFHCGCPITLQSSQARFALITDVEQMPRLSSFSAGDPQYPDRSATLILQVANISGAAGVRLSGPGLLHPVHLDVAGITADRWREIQAARAMFPCGVDIIFVSGEHIAALPRTTAVEC